MSVVATRGAVGVAKIRESTLDHTTVGACTPCYFLMGNVSNQN